MSELTLPPGIQTPNFEAFQPILERLSDLDRIPLLVYLVDHVSEGVLLTLADQFHVMGFEGWDMARTDAERRALVKSAIKLHRRKGTPWAVRHALELVGWPGGLIRERVGLPGPAHDGAHLRDGSASFAPPSDGLEWATFSIQLDAGERAVTTSDVFKVRRAVDEWRPVTRWLVGLTFRLVFATTAPLVGGLHNGARLRDGATVYGPADAIEDVAALEALDTQGLPVWSVTVGEFHTLAPRVRRFVFRPPPGDAEAAVTTFRLVNREGLELSSITHAPVQRTPLSSLLIEWDLTF